MKKAKPLIGIILICVLLSASFSGDHPLRIYKIPSQTLNLYHLISMKNMDINQTIQAFEISEFVTYKQYKIYLESVRKDSSESFYLSQLPDKNIGPEEVYKKYIISSEFDNSPVLGVSWDNAMNYCKWRTLKDNKKGSIQFIYRLPHCSEWLAANHYLSLNNISNDLNKKFSDWLFSSKDESWIDPETANSRNGFFYDFSYLHSPKEPRLLKRKQVIGDSYIYQQQYPLVYSYSYYADEGYRQIAFRYVKESILQSNEKSKADELMKYWGI